MNVKSILIMCTSMLAAFGCQSIESVRILDDVEGFIQEWPDSALKILKDIDRAKLITGKSLAQYSLLYTTALEKNFIDTTDYEVIRPAIEYYSKKGPLNKRMRAYYYGGSIYANAKDKDKAMDMYMSALQDSSQVNDDHYKELVNSAISDIFIANHNSAEEVAYTERALQYAMKNRDSVGIWAITGHLATAYANIEDWSKSDSVYLQFFSMPICDSVIYSRRMLFYSQNFLLCPRIDPERSVSIFEDACKNYGAVPSIEQYCAYAYANELIGRPKVTDSILKEIQNLGYSSPIVDLWNYRINKARGDYQEALHLFEKAVSAQDSIVLKTLQQSLVQTQRDFYHIQSASLQREVRLKTQRMTLAIIVSFFFVLTLILLFILKKNQMERQISELSFLQKEAKEMLEVQSRVCKETSSMLEERQRSLTLLKKQFAEMYKSQYKVMNDLCSAYWSPYKNKDRKETIYEEVKRILHSIEEGEKNNTGFEDIVNKELDNIINHLRNDLPRHQDSDFRFLSYIIAGFEAKTIANIMGYSAGSVYTKKNRLKSEIMQLSSPYKDFYLEYIS